LGALIKAALIVSEYLKTLWVTGKGDEWVLIMNNGVCKQAKVGLSTFKMPSDLVEKFPSTSQMVTFESEQVTSEMSGVKIKGMIIWKVSSAQDMPLKAHTNLGKDLCSANPITANNMVKQQASSIIRNKIANVTLDECLRNRTKIRDDVKNEMQAIVSGWGVHLEAVEITEVLISSNGDFKNLQAEYREKKHH
jgi:regulator of protease activity HflC (stomatin/prohibitin superfamily)